MTDMLQTIIPKSDQLNYDDLIAGQTKTIKVTKVVGTSGDQPIAIHYEGDNGKPYKPCKSMRRVLVHLWGADGHSYVGRSMTLYGDPKVKFGGVEVGGIRISHLSDIKETVTLALTATKASRKPFTVQPLKPAEPDPLLEGIRSRGAETAKLGTAKLQEWWLALDKKYHAALKDDKEGWKATAAEYDETVKVT